jgi:exodeoxyribonuclease III
VTAPGWSLKPVDDSPRVDWALAVRIDGPVEFLLVGVWTVQQQGWPSYTQQITATIDAYRDELASGRAVLAGDFNCWAGGAKTAEHLANVEQLETLGMVSAYHEQRGRSHGDEPDPTLYWRFQQAQPFHCDFIFLPHSWISALEQVAVGGFDEWVNPKISDHVPIIADVDKGAI